jgi:predicted transcriptional regulator/DNA-binding XRE family transcriptional regulator
MKKGIVGAKPRLFLRELLARYPGLIFSEPKKAIADNFAMPPSTVSKYLKLLIESGYVVQKEIRDIFKEKGVAKYRYQISEAGVELLNSFTSYNSANQDLITQVQSNDFKSKLKKSYAAHRVSEGDERYTISTDDCAFLLEALLCHSNKYGCVLGLTREKLSSIVGFKVTKIQRITKTLLSLGFITQVTPGLSGLFGIQPSIYHMALAHTLYAIENTEKRLPSISIDLKYAKQLKLPAAHLIENIEYLKIVNIDETKGPVDFKAADKQGQKTLEILDKLKVYLSAPKYKMIIYCNSLMTISAAQALSKCGDSETLLKIMANKVVNETAELENDTFNHLKQFLESTILSFTKKINDTDNVIGGLSPFFLENMLHIGLLLNELENLGYRKLVSINTTIVSLNDPQLKVMVTFESQIKTEGLECKSYEAFLNRNRNTQELEVKVHPNLKGII